MRGNGILSLLLALMIVINYFVIISHGEYIKSYDIVWEKEYGNKNITEKPFVIKRTKDLGFILLGEKIYLDSNGYYHSDIFILKMDQNGNKKWNITIKKEDLSRIYNIDAKEIFEIDNEGYLIFCELREEYIRYNEISNHSKEAWIIKINNEGHQVWNTSLKNIGIISVKQLNDMEYILVSYLGYLENEWKLKIIKMDSSGNIEWEKTWNNVRGSNVLNSDILPIKNGGFILSYNMNGNGVICKLDEYGQEIWSKTYDLYDIQSCIETSKGFLFIGKEHPSTPILIQPNFSVMLFEINESGSILWNKNIGKVSAAGLTLWDKEVGNHTLKLSEYPPVFSFCSLNGETYYFTIRRKIHSPGIEDTNYMSPLWIFVTNRKGDIIQNYTIRNVPAETFQILENNTIVLVGLKDDGGTLSYITNKNSSNIYVLKLKITNESEISEEKDNNLSIPNIGSIYFLILVLLVSILNRKIKGIEK